LLNINKAVKNIMNTVLRRELEQLWQATSLLLSGTDFDFSTWEAYGVQRAAIFAHIQGLPRPAEGEESEAVAALLRDILAQDAVLIQKAQARLASLQGELAAVASSRRALKGYASLPPAVLFQHDV
jgi:Flagellar protein FliT